MQVPLLDLKAQYTLIKDELNAAVLDVLDSQHFILGPRVAECESLIADYSQSQFGVGVSSGSDALLIALMAENIGPGDEVITTPYTFFATGGAIARLGATMVFVDIDPLSYNIDPEQIEAAITDRTRAIIPVHLYGQMAEMDPILTIAQKHKLIVIEDAAQAIGAEFHGRRAGSLGDYGCFSFFPSKNLGAAGDGGMVVTQDQRKAERLRILRAHGSEPKYYHQLVGGNFRLDALQAAVVTVKLRYLDQWTSARQANAARYDIMFHASGMIDSGSVVIPKVLMNRHIFNQYVVRVKHRNELRSFLNDSGIGNEVYYPVPLHLQECFSSLGYCAGDFPESEKAALESLAIPVYPELTEAQQAYVVDRISTFLRDK